jgi:hypothetical protein
MARRVVLTNLYHANDTCAEGNNDVDSTLKSFAATISVPRQVKPSEPIPITGYAQVGLSGLSKVRFGSVNASEFAASDRSYSNAPWIDARILPPPKHWGDVPDGKIPASTIGFDSATGQPWAWPMRLTKIHWATLLPGLPAGEYTFRCRTIDAKGHAQPMPRPFQKSGHAAIESVEISVRPKQTLGVSKRMPRARWSIRVIPST